VFEPVSAGEQNPRPSGWVKWLHATVVNGFKSLATWAVHSPKTALLIATLVTLAAAPGVTRLRLRTDGHALVTETDPAVIFDKEIRRQFHIEDQIVVLIESSRPEGIYNASTLQLVRDLASRLVKLPQVNPGHVLSLANEPSFRMKPGTITQQRLLDPPLKTQPELELLRDDIRRIELYTGTFVSADSHSTAILVGTPEGVDRTRLYREVREVVSTTDPGGDRVSVTGAPVAESLLGVHILEDLGVPRALLGATTRSSEELPAWKVPRSFYELRRLIAGRIGLVPVVILVMMLVFWFAFRNFLAMLLPLPGVATAIVFVFGLMGWLGVPVYLTIAVMPVLLTATGVTNDIYLFSRYFTLLRENPGVPHPELVRRTFDVLACPVANTSLTTCVGFLSFGVTPLMPVRTFGICTAVGVLFGLFYSFTVVPALLTLLRPNWLLARRSSGAAPMASLAEWFARLGCAVVQRRWWIAGFILASAVVAPLGLLRLAVQDSWTDAFDPGSEFRRATKAVNEQFFGMHLLLVSFEAPRMVEGELTPVTLNPSAMILADNVVDDPFVIAGSSVFLTAEAPVGESPGPPWRTHIASVSKSGNRIFARLAAENTPTNFWNHLAKSNRAHFQAKVRTMVQPEMIRTMGDLAAFIRERRQYAVGGVLGPAEYLSTTRFMVRNHDPESRRLPAEAVEAKLMWEYYGLARGQEALHEIVDTNYWKALTTVFLKDANFIDTRKLMDDLKTYERERLAPKGIKIGFAGDVALSQSLIQGIVRTQVQSLFWSLSGIYLIAVMLGGSLRWGVYCVLPSLLAVVIKLAVMGWAGIPLGVATSMFAAMTLGIGVNCAIQLLESWTRARADGLAPMEALSRAMGSTGPPALVNTLAVSLGFGVLLLSQVPANARFGLLVVLGLVECFIVSLLMLPVLLHWWPLRKTES
jgi:predicted RND superfamily exporter protein